MDRPNGLGGVRVPMTQVGRAQPTPVHARGRRAAGFLAVLLLLANVGLSIPARAGSACTAFAAVAAADGARLGAVLIPGYLLVEQVDVAAPAAQAVVDGLGNSRAYASTAYPGDTVLSVPATARSQGAPVPGYPVVAASTYPTSPNGAFEVPGAALTAKSTALSSSARAKGGGTTSDGSSVGLTDVQAQVSCAENGEVTAFGDNVTEAATFAGGVLQVGRVHSFAKVVVTTDGTPTLESGLNVDGVTVLGQSVGFSDAGLEFGDSSTPLPENPLADALKGAGIVVTYLAGTIDPDGNGVVAPGLRVELRRQVVGTGPTVTTFTFGRAYSSARSAPAAGDDGVVGPVAPSADGGQPPLPKADDPSGSLAEVVPAITGVDAHVLRGPAPPLSVAATPAAAVAIPSSASLYLVLVVAVVVLFVGAVLFRTMGIKLRWT